MPPPIFAPTLQYDNVTRQKVVTSKCSLTAYLDLNLCNFIQLRIQAKLYGYGYRQMIRIQILLLYMLLENRNKEWKFYLCLHVYSLHSFMYCISIYNYPYCIYIGTHELTRDMIFFIKIICCWWMYLIQYVPNNTPIILVCYDWFWEGGRNR